MLRVSNLVKSDVDECGRIVAATPLLRDVYGYSGETARRHLEAALAEGPKGTDHLLVVREGERIVGFAWFVKKGGFARSGYLRLIAVDPNHLKAGAGRALMAELERNYLAPHGLFLLVTSSNEPARRFYERLGYRKVGEIPDYVRPGVVEAIYFRSGSGV